MKRWKQWLLILAVLVFIVMGAQAVMATEDMTTTQAFKIKLNVIDSEKKPLPTTLTATFQVRGSNGTRLRDLKSLRLSNESTKTSENISYSWDTALHSNGLMVSAEMTSLKDASGMEVMTNYILVDPNNKSKVLARGTAIKNYTKSQIMVTLTPGDTTPKVLNYTLRRVGEIIPLKLKLTKAVIYEQTPICVDGTYYIGIFEDAACTKILYKKSIVLKNESSVTDSLAIRYTTDDVIYNDITGLGMLRENVLFGEVVNHPLTLYFAEVDKSGKVLKSGPESGFDIVLDKRSVTLSPSNREDSVTITNKIRDDSPFFLNTMVTIPKAPASVKAKAKKNKITVTWKKIKKSKKTKALLAQIKGIELQYSTDPFFPADNSVKLPLSKKKTKYSIKGLQRKSVYYVRVRYVDGVGGYSNWSKVKRVKIK